MILGSKEYGNLFIADTTNVYFREKYHAENGRGVIVSPKSVMSNHGIFFSRYFLGRNQYLMLFDSDLRNMFPSREYPESVNIMTAHSYMSTIGESDGYELRRWSPNIFLNKEVINWGLQFSKDLWNACLNKYEEKKHSQPAHVIKLGRSIVPYYDSIVNTL